jgi:hypothetical protein
MIDATSVMLTAFGTISIGVAFLHYRLTRNNKPLNNNN